MTPSVMVGGFELGWLNEPIKRLPGNPSAPIHESGCPALVETNGFIFSHCKTQLVSLASEKV